MFSFLEALGLFGVLIWILLLIIGFVGYILNIIYIAHEVFSGIHELTPVIVMQIVGIVVFPLGSIMGWAAL